MSVELKPCPFCGRKPSVFPVNPKIEGGAWTKIECLTRGCVNPAVSVYADRGHYATAAKRWNRRAERSAGVVDVTDEMIERFTDALYDTPGDEILECQKDTAIRLLTAALSPRADSAGGA